MTRRNLLAGGLLLVLVLGIGLSVYVPRYLESQAAQRRFETEADNIADIMQLRPGATVADIWAGNGRWSVDLAHRLGPDGHVYVIAGPTDPIREIYANIATAELDNLTVLEATRDQPLGWLQADCCDALLVRNVYHDLPDRVEVARMLAAEIHPEGRIAVIDFPPDAPQAQPGHGIERDVIVQEMASVGFQIARDIRDWMDDSYCIVFAKPATVATPQEPPPPPRP